MTDNQQLIEEAAEAIAADDGAETAIWRDYQHARVALTVFEKAHTPTDDEREALARAQWDDPVNVISWDELTELAENGDGDYRETRDYALAAAGRAIAAGFRRSEPSAEDRTPRDFQAYELTVDMLGDLLVSAGVAASEHGIAIRKTAGALVYKIRRRIAAEAQGEPSDAQVQAALDAYFDPEKPNWRGELARRMRAALRAASEAEDAGEGR